MTCHAVKANMALYREYRISIGPPVSLDPFRFLDSYNVSSFTSVTRDRLGGFPGGRDEPTLAKKRNSDTATEAAERASEPRASSSRPGEPLRAVSPDTTRTSRSGGRCCRVRGLPITGRRRNGFCSDRCRLRAGRAARREQVEAALHLDPKTLTMTQDNVTTIEDADDKVSRRRAHS